MTTKINANGRKKIIVIGLDAMTWDVLHPFIEKGKLPNLKRIIDDGYSGTLVSVVPPATSTAWVSFQTGLNPENHGIIGFGYESEDDFHIWTGRDFDQTTFYEILSRQGFKSFLFNLPLSYPRRTDDDIIYSWLSPSSKTYWPPTLNDKYPIVDQILEFIETPSCRSKEELARKIYENLLVIKELAIDVIKANDHDFYFFLISQTDQFFHSFFKELTSFDETNSAYKWGEKLLYKIDELIGEIEKSISNNTVLLIISDHGFRDFKKSFHINTWLERNGYLKSSILDKELKNTNELVKKQKFTFFQKLINRFISLLAKINQLINNNRLINSQIKLYKTLSKVLEIKLNLVIDRKNSIAYSPHAMAESIIINNNCINKNLVKKEIMNKLKAECRINAVDPKEEFNGKYSKRFEDLIIINNKYMISTVNFGKIWSNQGTLGHDCNGIIIAKGLHIKNDKNQTAKIVDVAPTILNIMNCKIPPDVDGKKIDLFINS